MIGWCWCRVCLSVYRSDAPAQLQTPRSARKTGAAESRDGGPQSHP
ncbi:unnamed protein product [Callosobruchus maculatus]|uniref:Uncharacterized protein n=1 Tax=Callosobruchus maculatus TaxID=64391 RepID=A0A653BSR8_CALMS|nr:unnamed protein product [Callosobruchus maculatus]